MSGARRAPERRHKARPSDSPRTGQAPAGARRVRAGRGSGAGRPGATAPASSLPRCGWARLTNPLYLDYHDREWGVPSHDDRHLFEMLILEGAQAGLSWETILNRRPGYRRAFANFDPERVAAFDAAKRRALLADPGIIRNRLKVEAAVANAKAFLEVQREFGSFDAWLWSFVGGAQVPNHFVELREIPPETEASRALSRALRKRGFRFVGPTITYAFMQAVGMVNDHVVGCFRHRQVGQARARRPRALIPSRGRSPRGTLPRSGRA